MPSLSVVVATTQPWPEARLALDAILPEAARLGAEVRLVCASPAAAPPGPLPGLRVDVIPGQDVFALRAHGLRASAGDVVALTEDHCRPAPDWLDQVLRAHAEAPRAAVIGGSVDNGADSSLVDWANFLLTNAPFLPGSPTPSVVAGAANVSYKRAALALFPDDGRDEGAFRLKLLQAGWQVIHDPRLRVAHVQSLGWWGSVVIHFHDGRCCAGGWRRRMAPAAWCGAVVRMLALPVRVWVAPSRVLGRILRHQPGLRSRALRAWPAMVLIMTGQALGEMAGYLTGPGDSPARMR